MVQWKQDLQQPFQQSFDSPAAGLFESIYVFANAGTADDQPATVPDILGNHDLTMTYGTVGGLNSNGDMIFSDKVSSGTNTYGEITDINTDWTTAREAQSAILLVDTIVAPSTHPTSQNTYLAQVGWFVTGVDNVTREVYVHFRSKTGHGVDFTGLPVVQDGDPLTIVCQMDYTLERGVVVINGELFVGTQRSDPWLDAGTNTRPSDNHRFISRNYAWDNYYGWSAPINLVAHGHQIASGHELTDQELVYLCNNPFSILETRQDTVKRYGLQFDTGISSQVELPSPISPSGDFKCRIKFVHFSNGTGQTLLGRKTGFNDVLRLNSNTTGLLKAGSLSETINFSTTLVGGETYDWIFVRSSGVYDIVDATTGVSVLVETKTIPSVWTFEKFGNFSEDFSNQFGGQLLEWGLSYENISHILSFDKTRGQYVKSENSDLIAELIGFPQDAGYVQAWGVSDGLEFDGVDDLVDIQMQNMGVDGNAKWELEIALGSLGAANDGWHRLLQTSTGDASHSVIINEVLTAIRFKERNAEVEWGSITNLTPTSIIKFVVTGSATGIELFVDGVSYGKRKDTIDVYINLNVLGYHWGKYLNGKVKYIKYTDNHDATASRFYDFTKIKGNSLTVPETLNDQDGTMVGFPSNGVFVPERSKNVIGHITSAATGGNLPTRSVVNSLNWELEFDIHFGGDQYPIILGANSSAADCLVMRANGYLQISMSWGAFNFTPNETLFQTTKRHHFLIKNDNGNLTMTQDGVECAPAADYSNVGNGFDIPNEVLRNMSGATLYKFRFTDYSNPTRNIEINNSVFAGKILLDKSGNDHHITMVDSISPKYEFIGYGEIIGYEFDGTYQAIMDTPFSVSQDWEMEFDVSRQKDGGNFQRIISTPTGTTRIYLDAVEYGSRLVLRYSDTSDATKYVALSDVFLAAPYNRFHVRIVKVGNFITSYVDGAKYADNVELINPKWTDDFDRFANGAYDLTYYGLVKLTASGDTREYDFTTGDGSKVIDRLSGKHASFTGTPTSGFMPVMDKFIYYLNNDGSKDFQYINTFVDTVRPLHEGQHVVAVLENLITSSASDATYMNTSWKPELLTLSKPFDVEYSRLPIPYGVDARFYSYGNLVNYDGVYMRDPFGFPHYAYRSHFTSAQSQGNYGRAFKAVMHECVGLFGNSHDPLVEMYAIDCISPDRWVCSTNTVAVMAHALNTVFLATSAILGENTPTYAANGARNWFTNCYFKQSDFTSGFITPAVDSVFGISDIDSWFDENYNLLEDGRVALGEDTGYQKEKIIAWTDAPEESGNTPITPVTLDLRWEKFAANSAITPETIDLQWSKNSGLLKSLTMNWAKSRGFFESLSLGWSKLKDMTQQVSLQWSKRAAHVSQQALQWSKRKLINPEGLDLQWSKSQAQEFGSLNLSWSKRKEIPSTTLSLQWGKNGIAPVSNIGVTWSKNKFVSNPVLNVQWSKNKFIVPSTTTLDWVKAINYIDSLTLQWSKEAVGQFVQNNTLSWSKNEFINPEVESLNWSKNELVSSQTQLQWQKRAKIGDSSQLMWSKNKPVREDITLAWSGSIGITENLTLQWGKDGVYQDTLTFQWAKNDNNTPVPIVPEILNLQWSKNKVILPENLNMRWQKVRISVGDPPEERTASVDFDPRETILGYDPRETIIN